MDVPAHAAVAGVILPEISLGRGTLLLFFFFLNSRLPEVMSPQVTALHFTLEVSRLRENGRCPEPRDWK